jgi:two-component system cell cycle sensor histidine kinase/response regulator CckA
MNKAIHILHLEDDAADAELVQATLEAADMACRTTVVQTRDQFTEALQKGGYDVILADYTLPSYDGLSALRLAQERCPDIPFIFVSGTMGEDAAIEGLTKGATDYVLKQKLSRLAPAIKRTLAEVENRRERQRAEKKLFQANERWGQTFDAVPDLIAILDKDFSIVQTNKAMAERLGFTPEECVGQLCYNAVHGTEAPPSFCPHVRSLSDCQEHMAEVSEKRLGGDFIVSTSPLFDSQEQMIGSVHVARDITQFKKAEEALKEAYDIISKSPAVAFLWKNDEGWPVEFVSPNVKELFGYTEEEFTSGKISYVRTIHPEDFDRVTNEVAAHSSEKGRTNFIHEPYRIVTAEGAVKWVDDKTFIRRDNKGHITHYQGIVEDVTKRIMAQEEKENLEKRLGQAQKMEAIGTLAGGIAHDFNNILTPIIAHSEMALDDIPDKSPLKFSLEQVLKAGERARDLVQQILAFSRQKESKQVLLKIEPIVKEVLKLLRASLPATIEIRKDIKTEPWSISADPTQIHQILMNLCTNASHAMTKTGGVLEIRAVNESLDSEAAADIPGLAPGPYLRLSIRDTGYGISQEVMEHIFEPYFTTKEKGEGTGLGLAVVHGIVTSLGGAVAVASEPGKGSAFHVYFPAVEREAPSPIQSSVSLPGGTERILLVDDEKSMIDALKPMLERLGYSVIARTSSIEALEGFQSDPSEFDLVVTDQTMPGLTGAELAKEFLRIKPGIPIILCSGFSELINEEGAKAMGIRGYVGKPIVREEMAATIRSALDNG